MLLVESLPEFSRELTELLIAAGEPALAAQVERLEIVDKCSCNDDFLRELLHGSEAIGEVW